MAFRSYTWKRSMVTPKFFRALFYLEEELTISKLYIKKFCNAIFWKIPPGEKRSLSEVGELLPYWKKHAKLNPRPVKKTRNP
jgi:hypothetical protein